jgi:hypothetical protein
VNNPEHIEEGFQRAEEYGQTHITDFMTEENDMKEGRVDTELIRLLNTCFPQIPTGPLQLIYHFHHSSCLPDVQQQYAVLVTKAFKRDQTLIASHNSSIH